MIFRVLVLVVSCLAVALSNGYALMPMGLTVNGQTNPIGTSAAPLLSWHCESPAGSSERGLYQSAWRVLVASSPELLAEGTGDLWDSGKVPASRLPQVRYSGEPLVSGQRCYWKVGCWVTKTPGAASGATTTGNTPAWSDVASWEVAPVTPADWKGAIWIDDGQPLPENDAAFYDLDPAPRLRRDFVLRKPIVSARLHIAGLGYYTASVNGERVGDHELDSVWTEFGQRILFSSFDVTDQVQRGENCIAMELGNGWFNPLPLRMWGHRNIRKSIETGRPRAIACLVVEHEDATQSVITTDEEWKWKPGPTLFNSVYLGEFRDARLDQAGWDEVGSEGSGWKSVRVVDASLEPLTPMVTPPIRAGRPIDAVAITSPEPGVQIVDFGENFTGVPEVSLQAPAGTELKFRFGELLYPDGTLNPMTSVCGQIKGNRKLADGTVVPKGGPGAPEFAWQEDRYICRGAEAEVYRPRFTFHGFRFMEVTGLPESATAAFSVDDIKGFSLHSDLQSIGEFACSNERLNEIQETTRRTFLANVVGVQSDCPHRERFGYGGDIAVTSEAFLMNFDMSGFYAKTVRDWADAARPDGNLTDTAPFVGINYCGVGWAMAHPLLIEQLYRHYGDESLVEEQLPVAMKWLALENAARKNGLVVKGLGDHEALTRSGGPVITTAMFVDVARRIARLCRVVDREDDAKRCDEMADDAANNWAESFLDPETGTVDDGSQTRQSLTLGFGVATAASRDRIFDRLVSAVENPIELKHPDGGKASGVYLTTGIFGTRMLMEQLSANGRSDLAYRIANRNTFPSWGWMLENDATTLWEHWAGSDGTFSNNHPMFGSVSAWFFRWLGGIQVAPDAVGSDRITIRPQFVDGLTWVRCSHKTVRGLVESNWRVDDESAELEVRIPVDTTALIEFPAGTLAVSESGVPLDESDGCDVLTPGRRVRVGSGMYRFQLERTR